MLRRAARHVRINARRHPVRSLPRGLATPSSSKDDGTSGAPPPWRQIAILSGSSFVANAGFGCIIPVLPSLSESLSLGAVGVGVILSAPAAARVVLNAYMADVTEGRGDRGKLLGVQQAAVALGFIGGPALVGGLAEVLGPHALFHAVGVCNLLCVAGYALLPETHQGTGIAASDADAAADADTRARLAAAWRGPLPPLLAMQLAQYLGYACHLSVVPLRAVDVMAASPGDIGVLFSTVSAVAIVGAPLGGYLADFGRRTAVVPAASLTVLGAAAVPLAADGAQFYAAMIAWGLGASLMTPELAAISADVAPPKARGAVVSYSRVAQDSAFLCGPLAYGALADALSPSAAIFASSACSAAALGFFAARGNAPKKAAAPVLPDDDAPPARRTVAGAARGDGRDAAEGARADAGPAAGRVKDDAEALSP
ncbi:hypothetical protein JL720_13173 [Aureococcus anophagefferens]|nr:hypothetical protein JL720_13173 [Aureococcus anophagefferens]